MPLNPQARFEIVADDKTAAELRAAQNRFEGFAKQTSSLLKGAFAIFSTGVLVQGINNVLGRLEEVERQSEALGTTAEAFQTLVFTFGQFDLQTQDVADALGTLADRAQDAESGTQSFIDDFRLLGVEVDDLRGKRPAELFRLVAERVAEIEDPTRRAAGIVRIFGDDLGRRLNPLLIGGAELLDDYAEKAADLGVVLGDDLVEDASDAAEAMRDLNASIQADQARIVAENADAIRNFASALATLKGAAASLFSAVGTNIGEGIAEIVAGPIPLEQQTLEELERRLRVQQQFVESQPFGADSQNPVVQDALEEIAVLEELIALGRERQRQREEVPAPTTDASTDAGKDAGRAFVEGFRSELEIGIGGPLTADRLLPELTPHDVFPISEIVDPAFQELEEKSKDTADTVDEDFNALAQSIGFSLHRSFSDAFLGIETGFGDMLRRMAADFLASGLLKGLAQLIPGPLGDFLEAGIPGFQHGGSFTVGGMGGPDSQLVAFRATPGEKVTVGHSSMKGGGDLIINQVFHITTSIPAELDAAIRNVGGAAGRDAAMQVAQSQRGRI